MAEIGFIASVIALAGVGHSIAISLYDFANSIGSAAGDVKRVATEISAFSQVLSTLSRIVTSDPSVAEPTVKLVQSVGHLCENVISDANSLLDGLRDLLRGQGAKSRLHLSQRIRWLFMRPRVGLLCKSIESLKATLTLLIATLDYAEASHFQKSIGIRNALKLQVQSLVISSTDAAEDLQAAAQLNQQAHECEFEISVNSRLLENGGNDDRSPDEDSKDFVQVQCFQVEEEVLVEDNNGVEEQDRVRTKAQNDGLVVYVGNCVQAQQEVCRFARSVTERISTGRPHTSPTPTASIEHSHISATPNEHRYKSWESAAQSIPTSPPPPDSSPKPEQDVSGSDSKSAGINAESASLDALMREQQLLKQKIERIERGNTSSGDTHSSNQDLISQLQQLLSNGKQPDSHNEPEHRKAPVRFHDAIGRKFNFPFHLCTKWMSMDKLIQQAFEHVEEIGPDVRKGHYDLMGPDSGIIVPSAWESTIEPDMKITMHMWPLPELKEESIPSPLPPPPPPPPPPPLEEEPILNLDDLLGPKKEVKEKETRAKSGFGAWILGDKSRVLRKLLKKE